MAKKINARKKGHAFELAIRKWFKKLGWERCETSRFASKYEDDINKTDLVFTEPFRVQCKAVERGLDPFATLAEMPEDETYNILLWKKNRRGTLAVMSMEDFEEIVDMLISNGSIKPK